MFNHLKQAHFRVLDSLDQASLKASRFVYDAGEVLPRPVKNSADLIAHFYRLVQVSLVLAILSILVVYSRGAQFETMLSNYDAYFLGGLVNVSTTHDSAYYMQLAKESSQGQGLVNEILGIQPGLLLPYLLKKLAWFSDQTLEEAGRTLVYLSGLLTSFAAYLLFASLKQSIVGIFVSVCMVFSWPILGRLSIGMVDTDLLNLLLLLLAITSLTFAAKSESTRKTIFYCALAGLINLLLYLAYARPGFTLALLFAFIGTALSERKKVPIILLGLLTFSFCSGFGQLEKSWGSLIGFLRLYVINTEFEYYTFAPGAINLDLFKSLFYPTISEVGHFNVKSLINDYGNPLIFWVGCVGVLLFIVADWRRFFPLSPLLAFLVLYMTSGLRFGFYATPLILAGALVGFLTIVTLFIKPLLRSFSFNSNLLKENRSEQFSAQETHLSLNFKALFGAILTLIFLVLLGAFPKVGQAPPPVIKASELLMLRGALSEERAVVVSWWDYGYEVAYQTKTNVITTGANPANVRNIYLARAFSSMDPLYASDELRFATYFEEDALTKIFPKRPPLTFARDTHRDVYIFIPSSQQFIMFSIYKIAEKTLPHEQLHDYDPKKTAFYVMYHQSPSNWGPFQLVEKKGGAVLYKLSAPKLSVKR